LFLFQLIIHFGGDSSADEDGEKDISQAYEQINNSKEPDENKISTLSNLELFLREAKLKSSQTELEDTQKDKSSTSLLLSEQLSKSSEKKKERALLHLKEAKWRQMKSSISQNKTKLDSLKLKISSKQLSLHKAQLHAKKMHDLYLEATKAVSRTVSELNQLNQNLKSISLNLETDQKLTLNLYKECLKLGFQLEGKAYQLPFQKKQASFPNSNCDNQFKSNQELAIQKKKLKGLEKAVSKRFLDMQSPSKSSVTKSTTEMKLNSNSDSDKLLERRKRFQVALKKSILTCLKLSENHVNYVPFAHSVQHLNYQISLNTKRSAFSSIDYESCFNSSNTSNQFFCNSVSTFKSGLAHLHAYRLSHLYSKFAQKHYQHKPDYLSPSYSNAIHPHEVICHYDLMGTCNDDNCPWQHKDSYLLDPIEKLVDILTYNPPVSGYSGDIKNVEKVREHLKKFVNQFRKAKGRLGEDETEQIVNLVRKSISSPVSANQRVISRFDKVTSEENTSLYTFDDFKYSIKTRDRSLVLTYGKIYRIKANVDPDLNIKNRFFAPEGRPISAELETILAYEPQNVPLWLNLAYYHATRSTNCKADCINRALNVLSRALECNRLNAEKCNRGLYITCFC